MLIDFSPVDDKKLSIPEFAEQFTKSKLIEAVNSYLDFALDTIKDFDEGQLLNEPKDEKANDTFVIREEERFIGWSLAHLVLHTTASLEEGLAFGSVLARGVELEGRLRYEPDWRTITTKAQVLQRLAESRRMCMAFFETWPDEPHLEVNRKFPETSSWSKLKFNAIASVLLGLKHFDSHVAQLKEVAEQARAIHPVE